jgi:hypothetical protein
MGKPGRKRAEFDEVAVYEAIKIGNTIEGTAAIVGVSADTLTRYCSGLIEKAKAERNSSVQRTQYELAVTDKDKTMLIWLGKQWLRQSDKQEVTATVASEIEVTTKAEDLSDGQLAAIIARGRIGATPKAKGSNGTAGVH